MLWRSASSTQTLGATPARTLAAFCRCQRWAGRLPGNMLGRERQRMQGGVATQRYACTPTQHDLLL